MWLAGLLVLFAGTVHGDVWSINQLGLVNGTKVGRIHEFYAIKYADGPRFEQATPAQPWQGVRDATKVGEKCLQMDNDESVGSEDCLTLDVRSCGNETEISELRPVMVWIHGGGLVSGSSTEGGFYNGSSLIEHSGCRMVYIAIQYRLNVFGFLDHPVFPTANFGIRDQQLALMWIRDHIHDFGGDKNRVTIVGESAGGASVAMHLSSPLSHGLFGAAIAQSTWTSSVTGNKPRPLAQMSSVHCTNAVCPYTATSDLLQCLRSADVSVLQTQMDCLTYQPFVTVDGVMLTESVWKTVRTGNLAPVPIIVGSLSGEGAYFSFLDAINAIHNVRSPTITNYSFMELAMQRKFDAIHLDQLQEYEVEKMLQAAHWYYPEEGDIFPGQQKSDTDLMTDLLFTCMTDQMTRNHKHHAWRYLFSYKGTFMKDTGFLKELETTAFHTLDLGYVFNNFSGLGDGAMRQLVHEQDNKISLAMQDYWVSMATEHQPSSAFSQWPVASNGTIVATMLEFGLGGNATIRTIDFRKPQCDHIIDLFDAAFF